MNEKFIQIYADILSKDWNEYLKTTSSVKYSKSIVESNVFWSQYKIIPDKFPRSGWRKQFMRFGG